MRAAWTLPPAALTLLGSLAGGLADEYSEGYPNYEPQPFSLPCGAKHTGSDTKEVQDWPRPPYLFQPVLPADELTMGEHTWAEWQVPCAESPDMYPLGCQYVPVLDSAVQEKLAAGDFDFPVDHSANWVLGMAAYLPWHLVQAACGLLASFWSCCCLFKNDLPSKMPKKLNDKMQKAIEKAEGEGEPSKSQQLIAKCFLGVFMVVTIAMASSMEALGNRELNTAVHHAIHSVEGLTNYVEQWLVVGDDSVSVMNNVVAAIDILDSTVFGSNGANPTTCQQVADCMQAISDNCSTLDISFATPDASSSNLPPHFEAVPGRPVIDSNGQFVSNDPRQSCSTSSYTVDIDYQSVAAPLAGICLVECLAAVAGCTGAQFSINETECVLWLNNKCSETDMTHVVSDDNTFLYQTTPNAASASMPTDQLQCTNDAITLLANIDSNVMSLDANPDMQFEGVPIQSMLTNLNENHVHLCRIGDGAIASGLAAGLGALPGALTPAQDTLHTLRNTLARQATNFTAQLLDARTRIDTLLTGSTTLTGTKSVYLDESGAPYPEVCIQYIQSDPLADTAAPECAAGTCDTLRCIDNTFDLMDRGEPFNAAGTAAPMARTAIFTYLNVLASLGAASGLVGLLLGDPKYWKFCALFFFFWGPLSLLVCAPIMPLFITISDLCQDVEDIAIQMVTTSSAEYAGQTGTIILLNSSVLTDITTSLNGFGNVTNSSKTQVDDIMVENLESILAYYLKGCQNGATGIGACKLLRNVCPGEVFACLNTPCR